MNAEAKENTIRVVIVDDQPLIRRGLAMILGTEPDIEVVATAEDGEQAIKVAKETLPDVIVMDLQMPVVNGVEATREITTQLPDTRVIVLTTFDHDDLVYNAIRAGARAYLLKDATEAEVLTTIKAVNCGESYLSPSIARKVMSQFRTLSEPRETKSDANTSDILASGSAVDQSPGDAPGIEEAPLTPREERVLSHLAEGKTNKQIAAEIGLAEGTVKNYVSRIMEKLHAQSRTELAVRAVSRRQ